MVYVAEANKFLLPPPPNDRIILVFDIKNLSMKNADLNILKQWMAKIAQDCYPEFLHKA